MVRKKATRGFLFVVAVTLFCSLARSGTPLLNLHELTKVLNARHGIDAEVIVNLGCSQDSREYIAREKYTNNEFKVQVRLVDHLYWEIKDNFTL